MESHIMEQHNLDPVLRNKLTNTEKKIRVFLNPLDSSEEIGLNFN